MEVQSTHTESIKSLKKRNKITLTHTVDQLIRDIGTEFNKLSSTVSLLCSKVDRIDEHLTCIETNLCPVRRNSVCEEVQLDPNVVVVPNETTDIEIDVETPLV